MSLSPDQVYRSLRRTTAEIHNYTYDRKVEAVSHDSGISQMSSNDRNNLDLITSRTGSLNLNSPNGSAHHTDTAAESILQGLSLEGLEEGEKLVKLMDAVEGRTQPYYKTALSQLTNMIKTCDPELLSLHFNRLLGMFQYEITSGEVKGKAQGFKALTEMAKKPFIFKKFGSFFDLILLRLIKTYDDSNKGVVKQAGRCAYTIAILSHINSVLTVLTPLITTEFPMNLAAIKILNKMVQAKTKEEIMPFLPDLMPGLIQASGHCESLVRKETVSCMVALHKLVGPEAMKPNLAMLSASKLKLLHTYISRTQNISSSISQQTP